MSAVPSRHSFRVGCESKTSGAAVCVSQSEIPVRVPGPTPRPLQNPMENVVRLHGIDGYEFRLWFAPQFARYLRDRFASPEQVAAAFGVRQSTAWNWWNGDNRATGDAVARMFVAFPDAAAWFLAAWEGRT